MRFLKISLVILFTGLFISLFASLPVNAQSVYDDVIQVVPAPIQLSSNRLREDDGTMYNFDITATWLNIFTTEDPHDIPQIFKDEWVWQLTNNSIGVCDFNPQTAKAWALVAHDNPANYSTPGLKLIYSNDENVRPLQFAATPNRLYAPEYTQTCLLTFRPTGPPNWALSVTHDNIYDANRVASASLKPYFINWDIDYPPNYQGQLPPGEIKDPTILAPNYDLTIQADGTFRFVVNHFLAFGGGFRLGNLSGHSSVVYCEIDSYEDYECLGEEGWDWSYTEFPVASLVLEGNGIKLPEAGYYKFHVDNSDVIAPVPPFPHDLAPYKILDRRILVYWDGFSILEVNTLGNNDNEEVRGDENNISNKFFDMLDIPTFGLIDVVVLPLAFISNLDDMECTPVILPLPNNIGNLQLPCMTEEVYQPRFPSILTIYQTILIGLFSYYIALRMFGNIKELSNPKDDRIEVAKL